MPTNKQIWRTAAPAHCRGTSMLEVLITILILSVGMLGLAALQGKAHTSELESYQRAQALVLLQDIGSRMDGNIDNAASYVTKGEGTGISDAGDCTALGTRAAADLCEWSKALKGSSEAKGSTKQGAMIDGRGCVASTATNVYLISVVWQGLGATIAPATTCGQGDYDSEASRRAVTMIWRFPVLDGL
jgi:type IV pilus assembly protein PilV